MANTQVERFFLYGEPPRPAGDRFVHLELLDDRSRPANWKIRAHAHAELHHVFLLEAGAGTAEADGARLAVQAPCIVVVPAGVVHGFTWDVDSAGTVLTFSTAHLREVTRRDPGLKASFAAGMWTAAAPEPVWREMLSALERELSWTSLAHDVAIEFRLGALLVQVFRAHHDVRANAHAPATPQALLVARYRERLETRFRQQPSVAVLARDLGVSASTLRTACQANAGKSPVKILHERLALEAKRLMRYSNMSVSQVAAYLGFSDAAYFSRFFTRETGAAPREFKRSATALH